MESSAFPHSMQSIVYSCTIPHTTIRHEDSLTNKPDAIIYLVFINDREGVLVSGDDVVTIFADI